MTRACPIVPLMSMKAKATQVNNYQRYHDALQAFEKLRNQYPSSIDYVQAVPEALELLTSYEKQLSDMVAAYMDLTPEEKQEVLETIDLNARLHR